MPHDRNGNLLKIGDRVYIEAEVKSITMQEDRHPFGANCTCLAFRTIDVGSTYGGMGHTVATVQLQRFIVSAW